MSWWEAFDSGIKLDITDKISQPFNKMFDETLIELMQDVGSDGSMDISKIPACKKRLENEVQAILLQFLIDLGL